MNIEELLDTIPELELKSLARNEYKAAIERLGYNNEEAIKWATGYIRVHREVMLDIEAARRSEIMTAEDMSITIGPV